MNLAPTDREKLQAYLDSLAAVPGPQIVDTRLRDVAAQVLVGIERTIEDAERAMQ